MRWRVIAPDGERLVLAIGYIRHELKHGSYIRDKKVVDMFPEYFVKELEATDLKPKKQSKPKQEKVETPSEKIEDVSTKKQHTKIDPKSIKRVK